MFSAYCETHGSEVLLPVRAITSLTRTDDGIIAEFICHCGTRGIWSVRSLRHAS
jgi:hypothetical protein